VEPDVDRGTKLAAGSIAVGVLVLGLKYWAYLLTGSVALYSDAVESIVNVAASVAALFAVRLSAIPADRNHPYGHYKAEYFSAVLVGVLIVLAALSILHEAYSAYVAPQALDLAPKGLLVNGLASLLNGAWCWTLLREGKRLRSPALVADGRHLLTDVISSTGVLAGVALAAVTGLYVLDPALAVVVALNVLWSGWKLVKDSVGGLMDQAMAPNLLARVRELISGQAAGAIEAHDLRTRQAGRMAFIEFHLVVPGEMTVSEAHVICDRIEKALKTEVEKAIITIHVEPEDKAKHSGIVVL
jgi:cation diffusion facilitator family transporter